MKKNYNSFIKELRKSRKEYDAYETVDNKKVIQVWDVDDLHEYTFSESGEFETETITYIWDILK